MESLIDAGLRNALLAAGLALLALVIGAARRPALTHAFWLLVLLRLLMPPVWTVPVFRRPAPPPVNPVQIAAPVSSPVAPAPDVVADLDRLLVECGDWVPDDDRPLLAVDPDLINPYEAAPAAEAEAVPPAPADWRTPLAAAWLAGAAVMLALAALRIARFQFELRRAKRSGAVTNAGWQARADAVARRLGLRHSPPVWVVPGRVAPLLWAGWGRACLVLPRGLLDRLAAEQQEALLAHELAHFRRGDHWVRRLELLAAALYWWFPLVWWVRRQLREAEEQCCDAWVVWALPESRRAYATTLVETLEFLAAVRPKLPATASGAGPVRPLRRRLTMIMREATPRRLSRLGLTAVAVVGLTLLALAPGWGQEPPPPPETPDQAEPQEQPPGRPGSPATADAEKRIQEELAQLRRLLDRLPLQGDERKAVEEAIRTVEAKVTARAGREREVIIRRTAESAQELEVRAQQAAASLAQARAAEQVARHQAEAAKAQVAALEEQLAALKGRRGPGGDPGAVARAREQADRERADRERAVRDLEKAKAAIAKLEDKIATERKKAEASAREAGRGAMGGGVTSGQQLFEVISKGKDVINRAEVDERFKGLFDRLAERGGLKGEKITREQFLDALKRNPDTAGGATGAMTRPGGMGTGMGGGLGFGGPAGGMAPGRPGMAGPGAMPGAPGMPGMPPGPGAPGMGGGFGGGVRANTIDPDRIRHLEQLVEELRRELREMRNELRQAPPAGRTAPTLPPGGSNRSSGGGFGGSSGTTGGFSSGSGTTGVSSGFGGTKGTSSTFGSGFGGSTTPVPPPPTTPSPETPSGR